MQGNISSPKAAPPLVAEGPFCLLPQRGKGSEPAAMPQTSPALARRGSISRMHLDPFIPATVTPDVERRLHVKSPLLLVHFSLLIVSVYCLFLDLAWHCTLRYNCMRIVVEVSTPQALFNNIRHGGFGFLELIFH